MNLYEVHPAEAINTAQLYAQYLEVDAHELIREICVANNIKEPAMPIPAFLLKNNVL